MWTHCELNVILTLLGGYFDFIFYFFCFVLLGVVFLFLFVLIFFLFQVLSSHDVYSDKRTIKEIQEEKSLQLVTEASRRSDTRSTSERVV